MEEGIHYYFKGKLALRKAEKGGRLVYAAATKECVPETKAEKVQIRERRNTTF